MPAILIMSKPAPEIWQPSPTQPEVDVVIIGATLTGLRAADELHRAGFSIAVLDTYSSTGTDDPRPAGEESMLNDHLDALWINTKTQPEIAKLVKRFDLEVVDQQTDGSADVTGYQFPGRYESHWVSSVLASTISSYTEDKDVPETEDPLFQMYAWLETFCQVIHGPDARFLDCVSFTALVDANFPGEDTEPAADLLCGVIFGVGAGEVSSLYVLDHIKRSGGLKRILSVMEEGGRWQRLRNGIHGLRSSLASQLPKDAIHLSTPVINIMQNRGCITETSSGEIWGSKQIIMAIPTTEYHRTRTFVPPLFSISRRVPWIYANCLASICGTPWWRESGLQEAMVMGTDGHMHFLDENSILQADYYSPRDVLISVWGERDVRVPALPVDILTSEAGGEIGEPFEKLWEFSAGFATEWRVHIEGALQCGILAARHVINSLGKRSGDLERESTGTKS
ncbi:hypothetical protein V8F06_004206 [Rhypophila decipiens]